MQNKKKITHRCKELLEYNKNNFKPCSIAFDSWLPYEEPTWLLQSLEIDNEDWDIKYMHPMAKIKYCPFCAKELEEKDKNIKYIIPVQVIEPIGGEDGNK